MRLTPVTALAASCVVYAMASTIPDHPELAYESPWFVDTHKVKEDSREPEVRIGGLIQPVQQRIPELLRSIEEL